VRSGGYSYSKISRLSVFKYNITQAFFSIFYP
jgi:hypothetical protein